MQLTHKKENVIFFTIVAIAIIWMIIFQFKRNNDLKEHGVILNAKIINILNGYNTSSEFQYQFTYGNKTYVESDATGIRTSILFIGKHFPVIFSPKTGRSELLMIPERFDKYNIVFPDSLQWVLSYRVD